MFADEEQAAQAAPERKPRQIHEIETGTIRTSQEEERAAEEARRKKEAEEAAEEEMRRLREEEERRLKKENSWFNKFKKGITKFGKDIVSEE